MKTFTTFYLMLANLIFIGLTLQACEKQPHAEPKKEEPAQLSIDAESYYRNVDEYQYKGCEYITVGPVAHRWGSHKGDCKNVIHNEGRVRILRDSIQTLQLYIMQLEQDNHILTSALAQRDYDKHNKYFNTGTTVK